ncbi:hypothetical protein [Parasediminibacterium sp. JCM 36343]|uniref:hypothetical protein n=1 Tax=Parasediminibacterium sp. JCM 36343 TaxID=3374279 RepID=UPI00397B7F59
MKRITIFSIAAWAMIMIVGTSCKKSSSDAAPAGTTDSTTYKGASNLPKAVYNYYAGTQYDTTTGTKATVYNYDTTIQTYSYDAQGRLTSETNIDKSWSRSASNIFIDSSLESYIIQFSYNGSSVWPSSSTNTSNTTGVTTVKTYSYNNPLGKLTGITSNGYTDTIIYLPNATSSNYSFVHGSDSVTYSNNNYVKSSYTYYNGSAGYSYNRASTYTYTNYVSPVYNIKALWVSDGYRPQSFNLTDTETDNSVFNNIIKNGTVKGTYSFDGNGRVVTVIENISYKSNGIVSEKGIGISTITY